MLSLLLLVLTTSSPYANLQGCETYAPRLDGTEVTVCGGAVVRVGMAPRVFVDVIEAGRAVVISEGGGAWEIDASRLPERTEVGDHVILGTGGSVRFANPDKSDAIDDMNPQTLASWRGLTVAETAAARSKAVR